MARERSSSASISNLTEHTSFIGAKVPEPVKKMIPLANKLEKMVFRNILQVAVLHLEERPNLGEAYEKLRSLTIEEHILGTIYSGLLLLLQMAMRHPLSSLKQELFLADLKEIRLSKDCCQDVCSVVFSKKHERIIDTASQKSIRLSSIVALKWRVDVGISTSSLNRVLEPSVLMEITLSDGSIKSFEAPVAKFHELRYNVAYMLKEMDNLESKSILKI